MSDNATRDMVTRVSFEVDMSSLDKVFEVMDKVKQSMSALDNTNFGDINNSLQAIDTSPLDELNKKLDESANVDTSGIDALSDSVNGVEATPLDRLNESVNAIDTAPIDQLSNSVNNINTSGLDSVSNSINGINTAPLDSANASTTALNSTLNGMQNNPVFNKLNAQISKFDNVVGNARNRVSELVKKVGGIVTHPVQSLNNAFAKVKTTVGNVKNSLQQTIATKMDKLKNGVSGVKAALTQGQTGAKGLLTGLKNLGKVTISGVVKGVSSLKAGLASVAGAVLSKAVSGLKKLGQITLNAVVSGAKKLGEALKSIPGKAAAAASSLAKISVKALATGAVAATGAVVALGGAATQVGKTFEGSMSQVAATMLIDKSTEEGAKSFEVLESAARECGRTTAFSASEAAEGLNYLALAGYDAEKAAAALPTVLTLAGAGAMDLGAASDMVTDSMAALGIEANETNLSMFADQLAKTASSANASVSQMGEAILTVGGTAKGLAGGTTELNTALGLLANAGIKGAEGGTHLRNMILSLQGPTDDAAKALKKYGVEVYDADGKMKSLNDIFSDLQSGLDGLSDAEKDAAISTIFNKTDLAAAQAMLSQCGNEYDTLFEKIENSTGAAQEMYDIQLDNLNGDIAKLSSGVQDLGISVYKGLQKPLRGATKYATGLIETLSQSYETGGFEGLVGSLGNVAADIAGKGLQYLPTVANLGLKLMQSFLNGIINNISLLHTAVPQIIYTFINIIGTLLPMIIMIGTQVIVSLINGIGQNMPAIMTAGAQILMSLAQSAITILPLLLSVGIQVILQLVNGIIQALPTIITMAIQLIMLLAMSILNNLPAIIQTGVQLIVAIIQGIAQALPLILQCMLAIWQQIIMTAVTTDWVSVGWQIISALGQGLLSALGAIGDVIAKAIASIFTGEDLSAELTSAGTTAGNSYASGVQNGMGDVQNAMSGIDTSLTLDGTSMGMNLGTTYASGLETGLGTLDMSGVGLDIGEGFSTSFDTGLLTSSQSAETTAESITTTFESVDLTKQGTDIVDTLNKGMKSQEKKSNATAKGISDVIKKVFTDLNLYSVGAEVMKKLNSGILSMKSTLMATARSIASDVSKTLDQSLEIHTPSGTPVQSGGTKHALGGLMTTRHTGTVAESGPEMIIPLSHDKRDRGLDLWAKAGSILSPSFGNDSEPKKISLPSYSPETHSTNNVYNSASENNTYSPSLTVIVNGNTSDKRELAKTVKDAAAEVLSEAIDNMANRFKPVREV